MKLPGDPLDLSGRWLGVSHLGGLLVFLGLITRQVSYPAYVVAVYAGTLCWLLTIGQVVWANRRNLRLWFYVGVDLFLAIGLAVWINALS